MERQIFYSELQPLKTFCRVYKSRLNSNRMRRAYDIKGDEAYTVPRVGREHSQTFWSIILYTHGPRLLSVHAFYS